MEGQAKLDGYEESENLRKRHPTCPPSSFTGTGREPEFKAAVPARYECPHPARSSATPSRARTKDGRIEITSTEGFWLVGGVGWVVEIARSLGKDERSRSLAGEWPGRSHQDKPSGKTVTKMRSVLNGFEIMCKKSGATSGAEDMGGRGRGGGGPRPGQD